MSLPDFSTGRLSVRPWTSADAHWYVTAIDADIMRFTREPHGLTEAAWLERQARAPFDPASNSVAVVDADHDLVGNLGVSFHRNSVELSYWIAAPFRGRGLATELLRAATSWVAEHETLPIELRIHPENTVSVGVAERAGYRFSDFETSCEPCADDEDRVAVYRFVVQEPWQSEYLP